MADGKASGSFRDPSGFVFLKDHVYYRQINKCYESHYRRLMESGLYAELVNQGLLIPHEEVKEQPLQPSEAWAVVRPDQIPFISYPYEWCFSQLKEAALTTLRIQSVALSHGMTLKDASAYNIQFRHGAPVLIDTLSFETYHEGEPWVAYRQFCQHFLAPLALMALRDIRLGGLQRSYVDGIPLSLASRILPKSTLLKPSLLMHLHLHSAAQKRYEGKQLKRKGRISKSGLLGIVDSLESALRSLKWRPGKTVWRNYYSSMNYSSRGFEQKQNLVAEFLTRLSPSDVWDLGANVGTFSRIASDRGINTVAFDADPSTVEINYLKCRSDHTHSLLPILMDLSNPSPAIGWNNSERRSLLERGPVDAGMALALVHHLIVGNNVGLDDLVRFFGTLCRSLIIEFVPKQDSQVQRMLSSREDVFKDYDQRSFEAAFERQFSILEATRIVESHRTLYLMQGRRPLRS